MKIVGIDYGHGETSAGYVNSENVQGNEIPMQDLQIKDEKTVIPSTCSSTEISPEEPSFKNCVNNTFFP